jgi:flagellar FliL protein
VAQRGARAARKVFLRRVVAARGGEMAKKANDKEEENAEAEVDAEGQETAAEGESKGGNKKKLIIIAAAALVVLLAAGGGGYFFLMGGKKDEAAVKKTVAFLDIREMTVNLTQGPQADRAQYLKLKVALEVTDPRVVMTLTPLLPRIEDAFQVYVRELRASDLEGSAGVYRLKEELLRRVNMAVYPSKVDAVLFKEIVVQ